MNKPVDVFTNVLYTNSPKLLKALNEERKYIVLNKVRNVLDNNDMKDVRPVNVDFELNVSLIESVYEIANLYYENNEDTPSEKDVIDFILNHIELLDIQVDVKFLRNVDITVECKQHIDDIVSNFLMDTDILKRDYLSMFIQNVYNAFDENDVPRSQVYVDNTFDIRTNISKTKILDDFLEKFDSRFVDSDDNIVEDRIKEEIAHQIRLFKNYDVLIHKNNVFYKDEKALLNKVEIFKNDFELNLLSNDITVNDVWDGIQLDYFEDIVEKRKELLIRYYPELSTYEIEDLTYSSYPDQFDEEFLPPKDLTKINQLAQQLIEENGIYNQKQANEILYNQRKLYFAIIENAITIGELNPTDYSFTTKINKDKMDDYMENYDED